MLDERQMRAAVMVMSVIAVIFMYGVICLKMTSNNESYKDVSERLWLTPTPTMTPTPTPPPTMEELGYKVIFVDEVYVYVETEYLGEYFVTAYCPEECGGSWMTSSGETCHYSDDPMVPTTCAIDRNHHGYGELLMIDGKLYITEDTGPGVKGRWVDCFVETMDEVWSWPTGWKSVYSAELHEKTFHRMYIVPIDYEVNNDG